MPSPFPGMDPYLEHFEWEDFHTTFNTVVREVLVPGLRPRYAVRIERRIYVEHGLEGDEQARLPDVALLWSGSSAPVATIDASPVGTRTAPIECVIPSPQERRETYLVIRELPSLELVTVIETLSPANKRASSDGRKQYLAKRDEIMRSQTNLIELDLLRGGKRLPLVNPPPGDYFAVVSRGSRRPKADVYAWTIRDSLPEIFIPLKPDEPELKIDLQSIFSTVYDRAGYDSTIDYSSPLRIPLNDADAAWRQKMVDGRLRN